MISERVEKAAEELDAILRPTGRLTGVGIGVEDGYDTLFVYLISKRGIGVELRKIGKAWNGLPVKVEVIGKIKPASS